MAGGFLLVVGLSQFNIVKIKICRTLPIKSFDRQVAYFRLLYFII